MSVERWPDRKFEGGAFHPRLETGRSSGTIRIAGQRVQFESEKGNFDLPLHGLVIALGGASDRLIFFTHPGDPEASIHTPDHAILDHPELAAHSELAAQIGRVRNRKRFSWAVLLIVVLVLAAIPTGLYMSRDALAKAAANMVPVDWEVKLGDKMYESVAAKEHVIDDENLQRQLALITEPLVKGINDSRYPLKFHIIEDATLNAFAIPGGHVVIHSGLLMKADTPEEVAGVLAHEIAHVTQRHAFRSVASSVGLFTVLQVFIGDATSLLATIANNSAFLLGRKFSRDFERDADAVGWDYLVKADIKPEGMIQFFKKMGAEEEEMMKKAPSGASTAMAIISTHPETRERLETLEAKWRKLGKKSGYREFELNYTEFKDSLRTKLHSAPKSERN